MAMAPLSSTAALLAIPSHARQVQVKCYIFGCPRVGNHAFAEDYKAAVPETWHIINDRVCSLRCWF